MQLFLNQFTFNVAEYSYEKFLMNFFWMAALSNTFWTIKVTIGYTQSCSTFYRIYVVLRLGVARLYEKWNMQASYCMLLLSFIYWTVRNETVSNKSSFCKFARTVTDNYYIAWHWNIACKKNTAICFALKYIGDI